MFFDLQRFGTTTSDKWTTLTELDETHYTEVNNRTNDAQRFWGFVPAGTSYTEGAEQAYQTTAWGTTKAYVFAKSDIKLKINQAQKINGKEDDRAVIYHAGGDQANSSIPTHGVEGNATAVTLDLYNGQTVDDLVVEGDNKTDLKITIGGTVYNVYYDGSVDTVAPVGLLNRADKRKLDKFDPLTYMKEADASQQFAMKHEALGGGEMTADGFVLKNVAGIGVATITSVGLDAETAAATYATKAEMRQYVRQVIASSSGYTFVDGSGTTVAEIPVMS